VLANHFIEIGPVIQIGHWIVRTLVAKLFLELFSFGDVPKDGQGTIVNAIGIMAGRGGDQDFMQVSCGGLKRQFV
jgi:hypothetical protein